VRGTIAAIKAGQVIGLMPEGTVGETPELLSPREGVGTFLLLATAAGAKIVPAGIYEEAGRLVIDVGAPFGLDLPSGLAKGERDGWARTQVMNAIKDRLPEALWGAYRD
jgi:hypothetical protein